MVNRTQALVLGFFLMASRLVILLAAPEVYDQVLGLPGAGRATEIAFLAALTASLRCWRSVSCGGGAGRSGRLSTVRRLGSLLTERRPCHAGVAATRETQGPWPCPALSVLRAKRLC
jgi:hypothetical protein